MSEFKNIADQEFQILVGGVMGEIAQFLKKKDYNVFVVIVALEMIQQNLISQTYNIMGKKVEIHNASNSKNKGEKNDRSQELSS